MQRQLFDDGMAMISKSFRKSYKPETINAIWDAVKEEPDGALTKAFYRVEVDFHPDALVPISKIRDIILAEGKKIREKECIDREREAQRQKNEEARSLPDGHTEYSRAVCEFLNAAFSGKHSVAELREMAEEGKARFPGMGFGQWLEGVLNKGKVLVMDRKQQSVAS